ncbi:EamA family transporter [candidate division KSB1 bacterium]
MAFTGYSGRDYAIFVGLAVLPTIGDHSLFLYAIRYIKAYLVNLGFLGGPIGAAILVYVIFNEIPPGYFYIGGLCILAGTLFSLWHEGTRDNS